MDAPTNEDQAATARTRGPRMRGIARAAGRSCSRPGCGTPAAATLVFSYGDRTAHLVELLEEREPQAYDLCDPHAARTRPPMRWEMVDDRPARPPVPDRGWQDEDGTVAVLAAALRGEPAAGDPGPAPDPDVDPDVDPDEDPLRAALEEIQRVVEQDTTDAGQSVPPTPLRRRRVVIVHPDDPDDEPVLW